MQTKLECFKSALAFFFLFFLHGTSIGTRQQGISYNVQGLAKNGYLITSSRNKDMKMNNEIKDELLPSSPFFAKPHVIGSGKMTGLKLKNVISLVAFVFCAAEHS